MSRPAWLRHLPAAIAVGLVAAGLLLIFGSPEPAEAPAVALPSAPPEPLEPPAPVVIPPAPVVIDPPDQPEPESEPPPPAPPLVCLDPGHPSDHGAGTNEALVSWQVAQRLQSLLAERGLRVMLTRTAADQTVSLRRRAELAAEAGADLAVRLYGGAGPGSGWTVYYPDQAATADGVTGPPAEVMAAGSVAAEVLAEHLAEGLRGLLLAGGARPESLAGIAERLGARIASAHSRVPTVSVELCVLGNPREAAFIAVAENQQRIARALADGIEQFLRATAETQ